jgi:hypothetical protein
MVYLCNQAGTMEPQTHHPKSKAADNRVVYATRISRLFDPFVVFSVIVLLGLIKSTLTGSARLLFVLILLLAVVAPLFLLLSWAVSKKKVSDWDISKRSQRPLALLILLVLAFINLFIVRVYGDAMLFGLFVHFTVWLSGFLAVTVFWKISGHAAAISLLCALSFIWFGLITVPLFLCIPLVSWARVVRHDHSISQTVAGALYSLALTAAAAHLGLV